MAYSNSYSSYAHLDDPYVLLDLSSANCCRLSPYVKCGKCMSKCDACCRGILQGASYKFDYDLAGKNCECNYKCDNMCGCAGIPNAIQSCKGGGLKCKYY